MRNSLIGGDLLLLLFIGKFQRSCGNFPCQWLCFQLINSQEVRARPQLTPHSLNFHFTTPASFFAQQRWFLSTICIWCLWELIENITHNIVKKSWSTLVQWYHLSPKKKQHYFYHSYLSNSIIRREAFKQRREVVVTLTFARPLVRDSKTFRCWFIEMENQKEISDESWNTRRVISKKIRQMIVLIINGFVCAASMFFIDSKLIVGKLEFY